MEPIFSVITKKKIFEERIDFRCETFEESELHILEHLAIPCNSKAGLLISSTQTGATKLAQRAKRIKNIVLIGRGEASVYVDPHSNIF